MFSDEPEEEEDGADPDEEATELQADDEDDFGDDFDDFEAGGETDDFGDFDTGTSTRSGAIKSHEVAPPSVQPSQPQPPIDSPFVSLNQIQTLLPRPLCSLRT